jgi:CRISPR-associated endonuclease Cas3-HD
MIDGRSSLKSFEARPGQSVERHLRGVAAAAGVLSSGETPYGDEWETIMETLAWTHDIGKLTSFFQTYVGSEGRDSGDNRKLTYHGEVSAFVTLQALSARDCTAETAAAGFFAVAKHHSVLNNLRSDLREYSHDSTRINNRFDRVETQLQDIDANASVAADYVLRQATDGHLGWENIWSESVENYRETIGNLTSRTDDEKFYGYVLKMWSKLVTADKSDASGLTTPENLTELSDSVLPSVSCLTEHIERISDTRLPSGKLSRSYLTDPYSDLPGKEATTEQRLAAIQTAANARATAAIRSAANSDKQVFELTLPTGFGKTYAGLRAALMRAEDNGSRVIYALPYTSIIDQVDQEVQEIFGLEPWSLAYTIHHHLADTRTDFNELRSDGYSTGRDTLHAEAWRSGFVLTTFTQLFESLAGPQNVQSMKLPALQDSVIVLDEPQAASLSWWALIGRLVAYLTEEYNATVIFMTATQPKILDQLDEVPTPTPLVEMQPEYTDLLVDDPRVEFVLHDSLTGHLDRGHTGLLGLDDAATELRTKTTSGKNTLAIVNTVESAATLSEYVSTESSVALGERLVVFQQEHQGEFDPEAYLEELADSTQDVDLLTAVLTTRLRPTDRRALLAVLDRVLDPDTKTPFDSIPTVTISTQLIEAGVDVSFDQLYRDFAPLPAIVQAAGRCNRSFGGATSSVTVWRLDSPPKSDFVPSELIYGEKSLLRPTESVFRHLRAETGERLSEASVITDGVEKYYEDLHTQRSTGETTDRLVTAFDTAKGKILRNASLIQQEYATQDVLVLVTTDEVEIYERYQQAQDDGRWKDARKRFQELKSCLISVPVSSESTDDVLVVSPAKSFTEYELTTGRGVCLEDLVTDCEV